MRLDLPGKLSNPASCGFQFDSNDKCWRCGGVGVLGEVVFVGTVPQIMLPPLVLNNDSTWRLTPDWAEWLPADVKIGDDVFRLAGVTMHEAGHFTSLILVGHQWYYYNGLDGPGFFKPVSVSHMKQLKFSLCNAYYLIS